MHHFIDKNPEFSVKLLYWYLKHKRNLPWRNTRSPYKIWLSEIILQQTRVAQGTSYYLKFIKNYPEVHDLANATEEDVLKDWQGLGYYSRARNLHAAAKQIVSHFNGAFPDNYSAIKSLKGVGDYTAAAIASFGYDLPHAVIDGNVYRVLARIFGIETPIDSSKGKKEFNELAQHLLDKNNPAEYNQAIMEFGALQCVPKNPDCSKCIFQVHCEAFIQNKISMLPVKGKKQKQIIRHFHYLIFETDSQIVVHKRSAKGIWQNLYDFPLIEENKILSDKEVVQHPYLKELLKSNTFQLSSYSETRKHILSHQILKTRFFHFKLTAIEHVKTKGFEIIDKQDLNQFPVPKLIENYLNEETNLLSLFER